MEKIKFTKDNLRNFGLIMGVACLLTGALVLFKHRHNPFILFALSAIFFACSAALPFLLKPFYAVWMHLAFILAWVNTRIMLIVLFYAVFMPVGLFLRLFRADPLERKLEKDKASYWKKREDLVPGQGSYERQF